MTAATTTEALVEFGAQLEGARGLGESLGVSSCEALEAFFPAIVGNPDVMNALVTMLDPAMEELGAGVRAGIVSHEGAENFLHDLFHTLQVAAALGHTLGVHETIGAVTDVPADLSEIAWTDVPDFTGDETDETPNTVDS